MTTILYGLGSSFRGPMALLQAEKTSGSANYRFSFVDSLLVCGVHFINSMTAWINDNQMRFPKPSIAQPIIKLNSISPDRTAGKISVIAGYLANNYMENTKSHGIIFECHL